MKDLFIWMMCWKPHRKKCCRLRILRIRLMPCSMNKKKWLFLRFVLMCLRSGFNQEQVFWQIMWISTLMSVLRQWLLFSRRDYNFWSIRANCQVKLKSKLQAKVTGTNNLSLKTNISGITTTSFSCRKRPKSHSPKKAEMSLWIITDLPPTWPSATDPP